jgi:hypothetical protein
MRQPRWAYRTWNIDRIQRQWTDGECPDDLAATSRTTRDENRWCTGARRRLPALSGPEFEGSSVGDLPVGGGPTHFFDGTNGGRVAVEDLVVLDLEMLE